MDWLGQQASSFTPVLPDALVLRWAMPLFWAMMLAFLGLYGARRIKPPGKTGVPAWVLAAGALWCFLPGPWAPTYWLGLAFQLPSLMTMALCLCGLAGHEPGPAEGRSKVAIGLPLAGLMLGWVLLLDTFGLLPFAVYRLGFGSAALAVAALLAMGFWVGLGAWAKPGEAGRALPLRLPGLLWLVLALYVLTRLPTGNVFDALIDPWLWAWLHVWLVRWLALIFKPVATPPGATPG